jgi:hypothetical protein
MGALGELAGEGKERRNGKRGRGAPGGCHKQHGGGYLGKGLQEGGLSVAASLCAAVRACLLFVRERRPRRKERKKKRKEKKIEKRKKYGEFSKLENF